jgi:hypothetical protein
MRIIVICSSANKKFQYKNEEEKNMYITALQSDKFDKLPRGVVVCVALIATAYQFDATMPAKSKWAFLVIFRILLRITLILYVICDIILIIGRRFQVFIWIAIQLFMIVFGNWKVSIRMCLR